MVRLRRGSQKQLVKAIASLVSVKVKGDRYGAYSLILIFPSSAIHRCPFSWCWLIAGINF